MSNIESLFPRLYFPLTDAADELKCQTNFLLHLAATGRLETAIPLPKNMYLDRQFSDEQLADIRQQLDDEKFGIGHFHEYESHFVILGKGHCQEIELFSMSTVDLALPQSFYCTSWGDTSSDFKRIEYHLGSVLIDNTTEETTSTLTATIENMFLIADEVTRLKSGQPMNLDQLTRVNRKKPHGNTIINELKREKVFKAALAIQKAYPIKANENDSAWAACILDNWHKLYPEDHTLDKVQAQGTIAGYLRDLPKV